MEAEGTYEAKYDVEAMMRGIPGSGLRADNPEATTNPSLREFLEYGTLRQLIKALTLEVIPDPWWSVAACRVPLAAVLLHNPPLQVRMTTSDIRHEYFPPDMEPDRLGGGGTR